LYCIGVKFTQNFIQVYARRSLRTSSFVNNQRQA